MRFFIKLLKLQNNLLHNMLDYFPHNKKEFEKAFDNANKKNNLDAIAFVTRLNSPKIFFGLF